MDSSQIVTTIQTRLFYGERPSLNDGYPGIHAVLERGLKSFSSAERHLVMVRWQDLSDWTPVIFFTHKSQGAKDYQHAAQWLSVMLGKA